MSDDTIAFGEEDSNIRKGKLTHPYVSFLHIFFRAAALFVYLLGGWFSNSFIGIFVAVILLLSCDFWIVKNISGRLMVGLRWWNYIDDEGVSHWVFESRKENNQGQIDPSEATIFWTGILLVTTMWTLFFFVALLSFSFKWLLLDCIALVLNYANAYGYVKCKFGGRSDDKKIATSISSMASTFLKDQLWQNKRPSVEILIGLFSTLTLSYFYVPYVFSYIYPLIIYYWYDTRRVVNGHGQ